MSDLISRQAAIDKINERQRKLIYCFGFENDVVKMMDIAKSIITAMPAAQPEVAKDTNVPSNDCISRQAAMDALDNIKIPRNASWYPYYQQALTVMSRLPSAQPDIIRCRDCKHYVNIRTNRFWCNTDDGVGGKNPRPDDFCSRAERRADGQTVSE